MNLVWLAQQDWNRCWITKQQLARVLALRGHRILFVDPEWRHDADDDTAARVAGIPGLREEGPGALFVYTHRYLRLLGWRRNVSLRRRRLRAAVRALELRDPIAIVARPDLLPLAEAVAPRALVYYAEDRWDAFDGLSEEDRAALNAAEATALRRCDLALAVSEPLRDRLRRIRPETRVLANGADLQHFGPGRLAAALPHPALALLRRPRIGFVGSVDARIDQPLVAELARRRPEWQFVFAGREKSGVDFTRFRQLPNVTLLGYVPYELLPEVLRELEVCFVPYLQTPLTHACNPLKVFEYLATGLPVVSQRLDGLGVTRDAIRLATGADEFEAAIDAALAAPDQGREERLALAAAHSWTRRVDELEAHLADAVGRARKRPPPPLPTGLRLARLPDPPARLNEYARVDARPALPTWTQRIAHLATTLRARLPRRGPIRILVARRAALGDLCVLFPILAELRRLLPDAHVTLGLQPRASGRTLLSPGLVDEVLELGFLGDGDPAPADGRLAPLLSLWRKSFDAVLTGPGYLLLREADFAAARKRIGVFDAHPRNRLLHGAALMDRTRHESELGLDLVEELTRTRVDRAARRPTVPAGYTGDPRPGLGIPADRPLLLIHVGSSKSSRRWPIDRFAEVAQRTLRRDPSLEVGLTGSTGERELTSRLANALDADLRTRVHDLAGHTSLETLRSLLQHAAVLLSNDTGVVHLARAVGTPLVAVFGPENHRRWGPDPAGDAPAIVVRREVPCAPCALTDCAFSFCLRDLPVDEVDTAVAQLLARAADAGVEARVRPRSWGDLADAGHKLPQVAIVVTLSPAFDGGPKQNGRPAALLEEALRQAYPRSVVHAPEGLVRELAALRPGACLEDVRPLELTGASSDAAWRELLSAVDAPLIALRTRGAPWGPDALGQHVAALIRHPDAACAVATVATGGRARRPLWESAVYRRDPIAGLVGSDSISPLSERLLDRIAWVEPVPVRG